MGAFIGLMVISLSYLPVSVGLGSLASLSIGRCISERPGEQETRHLGRRR